MRLEAVKVHGLGPFRDFEVDLEQLGEAKLVAVVGANGAGKSTLLELALPGVLYRKCPTRGTVKDLATARDAYVEARVTNGQTYTIRQSVDAMSKKSGETLVLDADKKPVLPTTSVSAFDIWAKRHMPPPEVLFSSVFAPQGAAGFLGAEDGDRKAILLRTLGIERYEVLAEKAREHGRATKTELDTLRARIDDERKRGGDSKDTARAVATLDEEAAGAAEALEIAKRELAEGRDAKPKIDLARQAAKVAREKRADLLIRIASKKAELEQTEAKIRNNRTVLADAASIRAAYESSLELDREIARLGEELKAAEDRRLAAVRERDQHADAVRAATKRVEAAAARGDRAVKRQQAKPKVDAAVELVPRLEAALVEAEEHERATAAALESVRDERVAGADERIDGLRTVLVDIGDACDRQVEDPVPIEPLLESMARHAHEAIALDDAAVASAADWPKRLQAVDEALAAARDRVAVVRRGLADARVTAAGAADVEAAQREQLEAGDEVLRASEEHKASTTSRDEASARAMKLEGDRVRAQERRAASQREQSKLAPLASKHAPLANAEGRLAELEPQLVTVRAEVTKLEEDLAATPEPAEPPKPPALGGLEAKVGHAEKAVEGACEAVSLARARHERAVESAGTVFELQQGQNVLEAELSDWTRLGADLGRDGLQALEIDAAGPELTELVNDLLRSCVGPRWTVSIETTKPSADGKRLLEGCEVRVVDTKRGRDAEASTYSGGERVLLGEAVSLALTMLGCRRSGLRGVTLVRDESGAALDPVNGRAYVAMLRRAAELVGASRVLFVTHVPELAELADATIDVSAPASA